VPRPDLRVLGAVLLGATLYAYGATSEVAWLFLLAYWCWTLVAAAFVYSAWAAPGLSSEVAVAAGPGAVSPLENLPQAVIDAAPRAPIFEGDSLRLAINLRSSGASRGPVRVQGSAGGQQFAVAAGAVGRGGARIERDLGSARRGVISASGLRLLAGDPAGMFLVQRALPDAELAVVLPRFGGLGRERRLEDVEDATPAPRTGTGLEVFGVREYRPGDSLRRVHWRLSARRGPGQLVVREYEPPGRRTLLLVLDPEPKPEAADQAARIAASEAWGSLRSGGRVILWAAGLESSGEQSYLWTLLEWLARWPDLPAGDAGPPRAGETVAVTTNGAALEALELGRMRGHARAWLVGDVRGVEAEVPYERAGLEWPL
jgi:uncharacterized protein (DUF58 family)